MQGQAMKETAIKQLDQAIADSLLNQIPFFTDLAMQDNQQYKLLLEHSSLVELKNKERIIEKGATDTRFYFLLKGILDVYPDQDCREMPISQLSAGQVVGALSIINNQPRNASLASSKQGATLFATDFKIFGKLEDFSQVKLETKLSLLRNVVNNTRWKLEVYKMNEPDHPLAKKLDGMASFTGDKNSVTELLFLAELSKQLGALLTEWNNSQLSENSPERPKKKNHFLGFIDNLRGAVN